ncbi:adhesion G protein-coupled receptor F5 [Astyanax mexicanus]|uniref:adhesion G protein-coupled receptor F5 n=1 Tax=Astyanax mexicanus TaxID=7994 RepID=UPI0020CB2ACB|nr:adhesion G protein-coupled receptor F5 [Astyanax mexicanus]
MAFQWGKFKYLLVLATVFFILLILMEDKHEEHTSNVTEENSYTKKLNRLRKSVGASPVQYVAVAELTVPLSFSQDYIKGLINQMTVPISLQNSTDIIDINITAVCHQTQTGQQCICQNQYVWANNICLTYPACNYLYAGACDCISAKPTRQMCIPRSELPTFTFTIRIDVNADATLINLYKSYLHNSVYAPYPLSTIMEVSKVDLTTECQLNSGGYQCKCGDQYSWPCDTCFSYGYCDNITNATCGCINGFPKDGQFCQPRTELTNASSCEPVTSTASPTTAETSTPSPTTAVIRRTISMTINEEFNSALTDKTSEKYNLYSKIIKSSVNSVYENTLTSYKPNSVEIIQFRPGSVIADFQIATSSKTLDFSKANRNLASNLTDQKILVSADSFAETVDNGIFQKRIYPGKNMNLTCNTPDPNITEITWSKNGQNIKDDGVKYQINDKMLTVTNTNDNDNGKYACNVTFNSIPYINFQTMSIEPAPRLTTTDSIILKCTDTPINLKCCAHSSYNVLWSPKPANEQLVTAQSTKCSTFTHNVSLVDCSNSDKTLTFTCEARDDTDTSHESKSFTITLTSKKDFPCFSTQYGAGQLDERKAVACDGNSVGNKTVQCTNSDWKTVEDNCVLRVLQGLVDQAVNLQAEDVPTFIKKVLNTTTNNAGEIRNSTANIVAVVSLLNSTAIVSQSFKVDQSIMETFLKTVDVIGSVSANQTWLKLNTRNTTQQTSSLLLKSTEEMGKALTNENFSITTDIIQLNRTSTNGSFSGIIGTNSTTQIVIPDITANTSITTIVFSSFSTVLPARNITYNGSQEKTSINADVVAVIVNKTIQNISFTFNTKNKSLLNPQCVFWNFSLLDGIGGWDSTGCELKTDVNSTDQVTCECNHTTSFSILMSTFPVDNVILDYITYIGVGISIICLILSLIIEGIIWKSMTRNDTSYMRHVSIVNIALSLLIADVCFLIGAGIVEKGELAPVGPCSTATFFMHFFYLALFFWMLLSALLLLYRTVVVFAGMSKTKMMIIAFTVGYGAPLLIAVITVAATAGQQGYIVERSACWLNWDKTKAFLAFVIPALTIVVINLVVLIVVLWKMLRRGVGATTQPDEKHTIVVIARCVAILTPLFGLTWGFGIGTMVSGLLGIHIVFAILNSLQGFFILVFAILLDRKIREELAGKLRIRNLSSNRTRTTSAGPSSSSGTGFMEMFRRRNIYHVADNSRFTADSSQNSYSFINT